MGSVEGCEVHGDPAS